MNVPKVRVTVDELFDLADTITRLAGVADNALQYGAKTYLEEALPIILNAAKSVAFNEAQIRRVSQTGSADR